RAFIDAEREAARDVAPGLVRLDVRGRELIVDEEGDVPVRQVPAYLLDGQVDDRLARLRVREVRPDAPGGRAGRREPPREVRGRDVAIRIRAVLPAQRQRRISRDVRLVIRE